MSRQNKRPLRDVKLWGIVWKRSFILLHVFVLIYDTICSIYKSDDNKECYKIKVLDVSGNVLFVLFTACTLKVD